MRATVVTLEPNTQIEGVSFEEAFGENSELRGRGRAKRQTRRQARRMKRIADRAERKKAKQSMRAEQQEARQVRKDKRKSRKVARKGMGDEEETEEEGTKAANIDAVESENPPINAPQSQPTASEEATNDSSSQENEPDSENVDNESYGDSDTEELGDNADVNDEESSFDAETAGTDNSFDDENYDTESSEAAGNTRRKSHIAALTKQIQLLEKHLNKTQMMLRNGKLPSNKVAFYAKSLKAGSQKLSQMKNKLASMNKMANQKRSIPVKNSLQPKFSKNKIVVPAKGMDGEDTYMFDIDETSSFDGKEFVSKNKGVLIGLGIGIVAILVLNKMKVFK
jgi:hypothetical protein